MTLYARLRLILTGMSLPQKKAMSKISSKAYTLSLHCVYLYLYPKAAETNHWAKEVATRSQEIEPLLYVKSGRKIDWALIEEALFEEPIGEEQDFNVLTKQAVRHMEGYAPTRSNYTYAEFRGLYRAFILNMYEDSFMTAQVVDFWKED